MINKADIGKRIAGLRKTMELNQSDFWGKIGLTQGTGSDIERGRIGCSVDNLIAISDITAASVGYILGIDQYPYEETLKKGAYELQNGLTTMGVGNGGGNLFIQGSSEAVRVVRGWLDELEYLRTLNLDRFKKPVTINFDDANKYGAILIIGNDNTKEDFKKMLLEVLAGLP